jgi:hypothetical protein
MMVWASGAGSLDSPRQTEHGDLNLLGLVHRSSGVVDGMRGLGYSRVPAGHLLAATVCIRPGLF